MRLLSRLYYLVSCFCIFLIVCVFISSYNFVFADADSGVISDSDDDGVATVSKTDVTSEDGYDYVYRSYSGTNFMSDLDSLASWLSNGMGSTLNSIYEYNFSSGNSYYGTSNFYAINSSYYFYWAFYSYDDTVVISTSGDSVVFSFSSYFAGFILSDYYNNSDITSNGFTGYFDSTGICYFAPAITDGKSWVVGDFMSYSSDSQSYTFDDVDFDVYGYAIVVCVKPYDFSDYGSYISGAVRSDGLTVYSDDSSKGLLKTIIEYVSNIFSSVSEGFSSLISNVSSLASNLASWFSDLLTSISDLPANLWTLISDGLQSLFVPDDDDLTDFKSDVQSLLEERLGVVYQGFSIAHGLFDDVSTTLSSGGDYNYTFPGISITLQGEKYTLVDSQEISLDNDVMDIFRPILGVFVCLICTLAFCFMLRDFYEKFTGG